MNLEGLNLLASLNKISLIAFLITLAFIGYQFYVFKKELTTKKNKPSIPDFKEGGVMTSGHYTKVVVGEKASASVEKPSRLPLIIGIIFMLIFAAVFILGTINKKIPNVSLNSNGSITPEINLVASKGIKIYDLNWLPLTDNQLASLSAGRSVYIGLETIKDIDIDSARIRINDKEWKTDAITMSFNKENNVYYRKYTISTGAASLKIEAQLHSISDGWLGE